MPTNFTDYKQLPYATDFSSLNILDRTLLVDDSNLTSVDGTGVQYKDATIDDPTGTWVLQGKTVTAGVVMAAMFYNAFLSAETDSQTHLSAMGVNTALAKAASQLNAGIRSAITPSQNTYTYNDLLSIATTIAPSVNMTPTELLTAILPTENASSSFTKTEFLALTSTVDQYSNGKLTDNSVLQERFNVASSNRNVSLDGLSQILKAWTNMLQNLGRNI